tara:strand:+ start:6023 stop:6550 length:528 start_codon:yes stop_codon:yes gene_type:complete
MAIRRRNLSSPLAVSEFDDDKPKKTSKQKRENRKAVRKLRKEATTRTITRGMSPDGKGGGPNSRITKPKVAKEKVAKEKAAKEKKSRFDKKVDRKIKRYKKQGYNTEGTRDAMIREKEDKGAKRKARQAERKRDRETRKAKRGPSQQQLEKRRERKCKKDPVSGTVKCPSTRKRF